MYARIGFSSLALLLFTSACGDSSNDTEAETAGSSTGATTDDTVTGTDASTTEATAADPTGDAPTTGDAPSTSNGPTTDDGVTTGGQSDTTGEPTDTTGEDTTGPVDPAVGAACQDYCDLWAGCGFAVDGCVEGCIDNFGDVDEACTAAQLDIIACTTKLTCEQLLSDEGSEGPCATQEAAADEACNNIGEGACGIGLGEGPGECDLMLDCEGEPLKEMFCDDTTCECKVGGEKSGECAADNACMNIDGLVEKGTACCGF